MSDSTIMFICLCVMVCVGFASAAYAHAHQPPSPARREVPRWEAKEAKGKVENG